MHWIVYALCEFHLSFCSLNVESFSCKEIVLNSLTINWHRIQWAGARCQQKMAHWPGTSAWREITKRTDMAWAKCMSRPTVAYSGQQNLYLLMEDVSVLPNSIHHIVRDHIYSLVDRWSDMLTFECYCGILSISNSTIHPSVHSSFHMDCLIIETRYFP